MVDLARRSFITGLIAFGVTAPAIVRAGSLMPVKQMIWNPDDIAALLDGLLDDRASLWDEHYASRYGLPLMGAVDENTRRVIRNG
jgi:hypothetical protein